MIVWPQSFRRRGSPRSQPIQTCMFVFSDGIEFSSLWNLLHVCMYVVFSCMCSEALTTNRNAQKKSLKHVVMYRVVLSSERISVLFFANISRINYERAGPAILPFENQKSHTQSWRRSRRPPLVELWRGETRFLIINSGDFAKISAIFRRQ